jgi:two-component system chemotaxis response regulator CheB
MAKIKVLIVDDSAVVRQTLAEILSSDPKIEVLGTAADPYYAVNKIKKEVPDVITLDVEMPRMDGLTFLQKVMTQHPIPIVIISSLTSEGTETAMKALEYGAVDIITKPQMDTKQFIRESKIRICDAVKAAAYANIKKIQRKFLKNFTVQPKYSADAVLSYSAPKSMTKTTEIVVAIGASTGGTEAIKEILTSLPHDTPGIVIVQHMPEVFTKSYAERLNDICKITVKEAENNDTIIRGRALIAPGNYHMLVKRSGARYYVEIKSGPLVNRHRPSVDVLFRSTARYAGKNALGILLTGMGDDGAKGLLEIKQSGAPTIAQSEESCVVFGMPKIAISMGAAGNVLDLDQIRNHIIKF